MSKRYEREIEEILRRQQLGSARGDARPRSAILAQPAWLARLFQTPTERLIGLALAMGAASYLARLALPTPIPLALALAALALFWIAVIGAGAGAFRPKSTRYWRERPIEIGSSGGLSRRVGYWWWRVRVNARRMFRR